MFLPLFWAYVRQPDDHIFNLFYQSKDQSLKFVTMLHSMLRQDLNKKSEITFLKIEKQLSQIWMPESDSFWRFLSWDYETHRISLFLRGNFKNAVRFKVTPLWVTLMSHFVSQKLTFLSWDYETHRISLFLRGNFKNAVRFKVTPLWVMLGSHFVSQNLTF